jgi:hypothetical protein
MKSIKEKQLLVKWSKAMNEPMDTAILEEVERYEKLQNEILESVRKNSIHDLVEASNVIEVPTKTKIDYPLPPTLDEVIESLKEETHELVQALPSEEPTDTEQTVTTSAPSLAERAAEHITKEIKLEEKADSYQQPESTVDIRSLNDVKKKIQYLQDWIAKISLTGPGGGAGDILNLDVPTTLVTGDYTVTRYDYYVGVNCTTTANITLPSPSTIKNGREVIIKDESGRAQLNPIKVFGTVDNDTGGFEIRINNGAVQLIYRDGWRIV